MIYSQFAADRWQQDATGWHLVIDDKYVLFSRVEPGEGALYEAHFPGVSTPVSLTTEEVVGAIKVLTRIALEREMRDWD